MEQSSDNIPVEMSTFFDERASTYDAHQKETIPYFGSLHRAVAGAIEKTGNRVTILDLGCGTGIELEGILARAPDARITCIDISGGMLDELKHKYADRLGQIEIIKASFLDTPFRRGHYAYVVSVLAMHHLTYERRLDLYTRIRQALVPGGKYIEGDHTLPPEEEKARLAWHKGQLEANAISPDDMYHVDVPFSTGNLRQVLVEAGFSEVSLLFEEEYAAVLAAS